MWSDWLFGSFKNGGYFVLDKSKIPNFEIPDLKDFHLKPYVSYKANKRLDDALN